MLYNTEWIKSEILIRTTNWTVLTAEEKDAVILHEIGHALQLNHADIGVWSIMQSDVDNFGYQRYITLYDIYSLKSKWGM